MIEAYPLSWPAGYPRTDRPARARFKVTMGSARDNIIREIKRLGGKEPIISTNIPVKKDGLPYAIFAKLNDPGVAVYFKYEGQPVVLACDKWNDIADNMQAIRKAVEAIRGLDRWGVSDMLKRAFTGFAALPEGNSKPWYEVLKVSKNSDQKTIRDAYYELAKLHHPDKGGSVELFDQIQKAYEIGIIQL